MYMDPHGPGSTLPVEAFVEPSHLVGFEIDHPNGVVFMHYHDFYELALVLDGTGVHMVSGGEQRVLEAAQFELP